MSSRWRSFCFLNLLNLALSPFCDDICPHSSTLFVTQRAEDKPVRSSTRQATDGKVQGAGHVEEKPHCSAREPDCSACSLAADTMSCGMPAAYSIFRKTCYVASTCLIFHLMLAWIPGRSDPKSRAKVCVTSAANVEKGHSLRSSLGCG